MRSRPRPRNSLLSREPVSTDPARPAGIRVSVIIPAFREETLIRNILRQFTAQLRKTHALEIIVSDGGSTDRTLEFARKAADIVVENADGHRQTIGEGRNRGADAAGGTVLVFLNADVTLQDPGALFDGISAAFADPRVTAATCPVRVDPAQERLSDRIFHPLFNRYCMLLNYLGVGMGRGELQAVRADEFRAVGGYDESLPAAEDFDLFRRLRKRGTIRFLPGVLVFESPRRYRAQGYPRVLAAWFLNAVSVMATGRSKSGEWTPVR